MSDETPGHSLDPSLLARVRGWIGASRRVVALTGAGLSTDSGIPDFRGPQGVWTRDPKAERLSDIRYYVADPEIRRLAWQSRLAHPAWTAQPGAGHHALAELERQGRLQAVVTQNIDGLHQKAGHAPDRVIEVHGTMLHVACLSCDWRGPMQAIEARLRAGETDPPCERCGGILKSDTISFGQSLKAEVLDRAMRAAQGCDLLLAIGTTLRVYPVAGLVPMARDSGARVVIVNGEPTALDEIADAVLRGPIGRWLPALVEFQPPVD